MRRVSWGLAMVLIGWIMGGCGVDSVEPFTETGPAIKDVTFSRQFEPAGLTVTWRTDQPATSRLDYLTPVSQTNTVIDPVLKHHHALLADDIDAPGDYVVDIQATNEQGRTTMVTVFLPRTNPVFNH